MTTEKGPKVDDCVESIMEDNPQMEESTAFAICNDQFATEKLLTMKRDLSLDEREFIEAMRMLDEGGTLPTMKAEPDEIDVGDWVSWEFDGSTVPGKVRGGAREERSASGNKRVGEEGVEDVFELEEWEEETGSFQSRVVKPASELTVMDDPPEGFEGN